LPRWLGIDYGSVRIGLAVSDPGEAIASPADSLSAGRTARASVDAILKWCEGRDIGGFVVGLPLLMDGRESEQTRRTRIFADALRAAVSLPVELFDERLSSFAADLAMDDAHVPRRRRTELRDALAARHFLQAFLDRRSGRTDPPAAAPSDSDA
jgi:putative Holliday junction resolvase